jgi:hypothetical protein
MSFELTCFNSNPNFQFKEKVFEKCDVLSHSYNFDCYQDQNKEVKLLAPYFEVKTPQDIYIKVINLKDNKEEKKLEGHKDRILTIRHFQDPTNKKNYIISADRKYNVIVWDLDDYSKKFETEIKYEGFIYSCYLIFEGKAIWAVTSSIGSNGVTKVFNVETKECKDINDSKNLNVYYLDHWYNEKAANDDEKHVIIQCAKNKVLFSNYPKNTSYHSISTDDKNPYILTGRVFKNKDKDMFVFAASYGLIQFIDLETKSMVVSYDLNSENVHLCGFVRWNDTYLLLNDCAQRRIIIFDMLDNYKIKSKVVSPDMHFEKFIEKVNHPKYGECLLSLGIDWTVKLYVNRDLVVEKEN